MHILVTGGAGFIGSNIAERLVSQGYQVTVLDDLSTGKKENIRSLLRQPNFLFCEGSVLELPLLRGIIRAHHIQYICHQAARPSLTASVEQPIATHETNVTGTLNMLKAACETKCRRVVLACSSSIYGDAPVIPRREDGNYIPHSLYEASKVAGEVYIKAFSSVYGLETIGLRYFSVYGRYQDPTSHHAAVIPKFITAALRGEPLTIEGDGQQTRDFAYVDDIVNANLQALTIPEVYGECVNLGYGQKTSILYLAEMVLRLTASNSKIVYCDPRPRDVRDSLADISKARTLLGYKPEHSLEQGLRATIEWYRKNPIQLAFQHARSSKKGAEYQLGSTV